MSINNYLPLWGSRRWMALTVICASLILIIGSYRMVSDLLVGHPLWYYSGTFVLFGFTLLGLVLLVKEGWTTLKNLVRYGLHPTISEEDYEEFRRLTESEASTIVNYDDMGVRESD